MTVKEKEFEKFIAIVLSLKLSPAEAGKVIAEKGEELGYSVNEVIAIFDAAALKVVRSKSMSEGA